jgi:predicted transcriptional regulator
MSELLSSDSSSEMVELTAEIVSAYVANNSVHLTDLPNVIASIHSALQNLGPSQEQPKEKLTPLMPIKKTITSEFLISLEDGKRYKSLKRHLSGRGLTPQEYRQKWGLPSTTPWWPLIMPRNARSSRRPLGLGSSVESLQRRLRRSAPVVLARRPEALQWAW